MIQQILYEYYNQFSGTLYFQKENKEVSIDKITIYLYMKRFLYLYPKALSWGSDIRSDFL